jgi:hypothetical protein
MTTRLRFRTVVLASFLPAAVCFAWAANPEARPPRPAPGAPAAGTANTNPTYRQLRQAGLAGEAFSVHEVVLKRDAGTFTLHSGKLCFVAPIEGKVTGAVFQGEGNFTLDPPIASERRSLSLLTKEPRFDERYSELALRFSDETYAELKNALGAAPAAGADCPNAIFEDSQNVTRNTLHYNLEARILQDLVSTEPGGLFVAFVKGKKYSGKMIYFIDPHGLPGGLEPEEVDLFTYDEGKAGDWAVFHLAPEYAAGLATGTQKNDVMEIESQKLETQIENSGKLNGKAATTIISQVDGLHAVEFHLFRTLRVDSVTGEDGQSLNFIQEDKTQDPQFWVILPNRLAAGQEYTVTIVYSGKDAVANEGGGNYYPLGRTSWYPSVRQLDKFPSFDMTFSIPKGMDLVATGQKLSSVSDGKQIISHWRSEQPQPVAGFQFGEFKRQEATIANLDNLKVEALANQDLPGSQGTLRFESFEGYLPVPVLLLSGPPAGGITDTTRLAKETMTSVETVLGIFSDYFGPLSFKHLTLTQQMAWNRGQLWPGMICLSIRYPGDAAVRHGLHLEDPHAYFKVVVPHEVAYQWWGQTVRWGSYRDRWLTEGLAEFSAALYVQQVWRDHPEEFQKFWSDRLEMLVQKNPDGLRLVDAGPLTLGQRLNNGHSGSSLARQLVASKGAFVLHMLRAMLWDPKTHDERFKEMMHDFVSRYAGRSATTEDFKATVERHMTPLMNSDGTGKMDWFFNEYVYGTALPSYRLESSFDKDASGNIRAHLKLTQSNVDDSFRMPVPIYLELADGKIAFMERALVMGNSTWEATVPIHGVKATPRRALINYFNDVLCAK